MVYSRPLGHRSPYIPRVVLISLQERILFFDCRENGGSGSWATQMVFFSDFLVYELRQNVGSVIDFVALVSNWAGRVWKGDKRPRIPLV